mgnify:FL=1
MKYLNYPSFGPPQPWSSRRWCRVSLRRMPDTYRTTRLQEPSTSPFDSPAIRWKYLQSMTNPLRTVRRWACGILLMKRYLISKDSGQLQALFAVWLLRTLPWWVWTALLRPTYGYWQYRWGVLIGVVFISELVEYSFDFRELCCPFDAENVVGVWWLCCSGEPACTKT